MKNINRTKIGASFLLVIFLTLSMSHNFNVNEISATEKNKTPFFMDVNTLNLKTVEQGGILPKVGVKKVILPEKLPEEAQPFDIDVLVENNDSINYKNLNLVIELVETTFNHGGMTDNEKGDAIGRTPLDFFNRFMGPGEPASAAESDTQQDANRIRLRGRSLERSPRWRRSHQADHGRRERARPPVFPGRQHHRLYR